MLRAGALLLLAIACACATLPPAAAAAAVASGQGHRRELRNAIEVFAQLPGTLFELVGEKFAEEAVSGVLGPYIMVDGIAKRWDSDACDIQSAEVSGTTLCTGYGCSSSKQISLLCTAALCLQDFWKVFNECQDGTRLCGKGAPQWLCMAGCRRPYQGR